MRELQIIMYGLIWLVDTFWLKIFMFCFVRFFVSLVDLVWFGLILLGFILVWFGFFK